ncbi:uncharacterized protein C9orf153 homolog isoform X2 [Choloepus didactylus]|uniref:uncharacterized protein C9orf153 homolog isoform X2 n=1 Tax=Choloepus didactylus TaxID=27675 RepID=UPI00189EBBEF|nr:uncharacterized protein C9orf153 homolog isoform X2 [Choloepus didactylus]
MQTNTARYAAQKKGINCKISSTTYLIGGNTPVKYRMETRIPGCSLPELYAFLENFNKKNKKSNIRKTHDISLSDVKRILSQNLDAMSFISETGVRREDSQPVFMCTVVKKEEGKKPKSMTELLHCSLLTSSLIPAERLLRSQEKLSQRGIPPPKYNFPYDILVGQHPVSSSLTALGRKMQASKTICRLVITKAFPEKFVCEVKVPKYFLINPVRPGPAVLD